MSDTVTVRGLSRCRGCGFTTAFMQHLRSHGWGTVGYCLGCGAGRVIPVALRPTEPPDYSKEADDA